MYILFFEDHLEIWNKLLDGYYKMPNMVLSASKLADVPEEIFEKLSEEQIESIYYFFFDLETNK